MFAVSFVILSSLVECLDAGVLRVEHESNKSWGSSETSNPPAPSSYVVQRGTIAFYLLCGIGGMMSCSLTHLSVVVLDGIKCRIQVDHFKYRSVAQCFRVTFSEEGVRGLIRGWLPTLIGYGLQGFAKFGLYETFKALLMPEADTDSNLLTLIYFVSAAGAELVADILLIPMEAGKVRMQTDVVDEGRTMMDTMESILKEEGIRGFYKGLPALWLRQIPYTMMKFASFERFVTFIYWSILNTNPHHSGPALRLVVTFVAGYFAGIVCALVSHPADTILSILNHRRGSSFVDVARELGFWGVWSGLGPRIIMIGSMTALQWFIYDGVKVWLRIPPPPLVFIKE